MEYLVSNHDLEMAAGNLQEVFSRYPNEDDSFFGLVIWNIAHAMFSEGELVDEVMFFLVGELNDLRKEDEQYANVN